MISARNVTKRFGEKVAVSQGLNSGDHVVTDGVLLVVRAGATDRNAAQRAYQQLANVGGRVVGTVLNDPGGEVAKEGYYYYPYDYAAEEQ